MSPNPKYPGEVPDTPEELPMPEKLPEVKPPAAPESPVIPSEEPEKRPDEGPFQPGIGIPPEIPPLQSYKGYPETGKNHRGYIPASGIPADLYYRG